MEDRAFKAKGEHTEKVMLPNKPHQASRLNPTTVYYVSRSGVCQVPPLAICTWPGLSSDLRSTGESLEAG